MISISRNAVAKTPDGGRGEAGPSSKASGELNLFYGAIFTAGGGKGETNRFFSKTPSKKKTLQAINGYFDV